MVRRHVELDKKLSELGWVSRIEWHTGNQIESADAECSGKEPPLVMIL